MWTAILLGAVFFVIVVVAAVDQARNPRPVQPKRKRYVMRGYGGGKNATSLHPRQAKQGKRLVFIPGVRFRHVRPAKKR
jgi:hypothetical protein